MRWYYADGEKPAGPVTRQELDRLFEAGTVTNQTMVIQEGMGYWVPYVDLKKTTQILPVSGEMPKGELKE